MRKFFLTAFASFILSCFFMAEGKASVLTFDLAPFTGDPAKAQIKVDDNTANLFRVIVNVTPESITGNIGDITGVFFDFSPLVTLSNINLIQGGSIIGFANNTNNLGGGVNLIGGGANNPGLFDAGLRFPGFSVDDIQKVEFTIDRTDSDLAGLTLADFTGFGLRLQTVGPLGSARGGSSKLSSTSSFVTQNIPHSPEPATILLLGLGFAGSALKLRRKK